MNIIPEMHPHNMCMYVSKEQLGDKRRSVIVVLVSGIMFLIMLIRNVLLVHSRNASEDCSCFQTMTLLHDSAIMHGSVNGNDAFSVYKCVNMYMYMHVCHMRYLCGYTCAWKKVFYTGRPPALCTVSVLHSQNNLLCIIDIGAHKPLWLQAPFTRFYMFHVY